MPKREDEEKSSTGRRVEETREALEFCFEDVSSLRMVGAAPLNDLYSSGSQRRASDATPETAAGGSRWNLFALALLVLAMVAVTAATLLR